MKSALRLSSLALGALVATFAAGCATDEAKPAAEQQSTRQRGETITGSNIPNKNAQPAQSDAERQKTVERMKEMQERSVPPQKLPN